MAAALFACAGWHSLAAAQNLPDPANIELPDLSANDPAVTKKGHKFFYFFNPTVSFSEAYEDISECRSYLVTGEVAMLPGFVPWVEEVAPEEVKSGYGANPYGLVGALIVALFQDGVNNGPSNNRLRLCMEPRGYARYPLTEDAWLALNKGDEPNIVAMQAKLASGPAPTVPQVTE